MEVLLPSRSFLSPFQEQRRAERGMECSALQLLRIPRCQWTWACYSWPVIGSPGGGWSDQWDLGSRGMLLAFWTKHRGARNSGMHFLCHYTGTHTELVWHLNHLQPPTKRITKDWKWTKGMSKKLSQKHPAGFFTRLYYISLAVSGSMVLQLSKCHIL